MAWRTVKDIEEELRTTGESPSRARVSLLNELAGGLVAVDIERAASVSREAMEMARQLDFTGGEAEARLGLAFHDFFVADYEPALEKSRESLSRFEEENDRNGIAKVLLLQGLVYWSLGDYEDAIESLHSSIELCREVGNLESESWALTSLGGIYEGLGDFDQAIGLQVRSLELFRKLGHKLGEGRALSGLGMVYQRLGQNDAALEQHSESLKLYREVSSALSEARALNDIGITYQAMGDSTRALEFLRQALEMRERLRNRPAAITTLLNIGKLYNEKRNVVKALDYLKRAVELAAEVSAKPKLYQAHEALSKSYEIAGNYQKALYHQRESQRIKEEVLSDDTNTKLRNLQIKYEVENAEKQAEIQRLRNVELAEALEKLKQAQAQLIQSEKMAALGKLVAGVAHEINSPVGVIRSGVNLSLRATERIIAEISNGRRLEEMKGNQPIPRAIETLETTAATTDAAVRRIAKIVETLKSFSRLDQAEFQLVDVHEGIEATLELLEPQWGERIRVVKKFGDVPKIESFPNELNQAFMTLLMNAGEAIEGRGAITIKTSVDDGKVRISTSDTGRGIPPDRLEHVFEIGFSQKGAQMRMHVGLANVHAIVEKHRGHIEARSELNEGTTFVITLPVIQSRQSSPEK